MEALEVTFRIVTPLYLAGADSRKAEFRLPSIKGALRFWYRAMDEKYKCLHPDGMTYEEKLFGGSSGKAGQSQFLMRMQNAGLKQKFNSFRHDEHFTVQFVMRKELPNKEDQRDENDQLNEWRGLISSIWLLGHLGGLGSGANKGKGTVALKRWHIENKKVEDLLLQLPIAHEKKTLEEWEEAFKQGMKVIQSGGWFQSHTSVSHTVLSSQSSFYLLKNKEFKNWRSALDKGVEDLKKFRKEQNRKLKHVDGEDGNPDLPDYQEVVFPLLRVIQIGRDFYPFFAVLSAPASWTLIPDMIEELDSKRLPPDHSLESFKNHLQESGFVEVSSFR